MVFPRSSKDVNFFLNHVEAALAQDKIKISFKTPSPNEKYQIGGYFDDYNKKLYVANQPQWLEILVHEYAHYLQWKNNDPTFLAYYDYETCPTVQIEQWIEHKTAYTKEVRDSFRIIRNNEFACEKLACKLIQQYNLPIDVGIYKRKSNRYIIFYHFVEKTRIWNASPDFRSDTILHHFPDTLRSTYLQQVPKRLQSLKCFFKD
jgi:hypothetical protein